MIEVSNLIFVLRDKLSEIGLDRYDDRVAYRDLKDAYETIRMIGESLALDIDDYTTFATYKVERCIVRVGTYHAYRNYTRLADRNDGSSPETAPLHITYDVVDAQNCLSLLFGTKINEQLLPEILEQTYKPVTPLNIGPSIIDAE